MKNSEMPAMPIFDEDAKLCVVRDPETGVTDYASGLTKREQACIALGVPETGDKELDAIIRKSERKRMASEVMQGLASLDRNSTSKPSDIARRSVALADALLKELEK